MQPTLYVVAGPNGAGKTTFYETSLKRRLPDVEFVNADRLAHEKLGHAAVTLEQSKLGQQLADERRSALMQQGQSLITESTFSHESKLQLVREALAAGYRVELFHLNLRNAELAVKRVSSRVQKGGHPVPEEKTRERYERNQPLIRDAAKLSDVARVFDNSQLGQPARQVIVLEHGVATRVRAPVPTWARDLYAPELQQYSPARINRPAASFSDAKEIVKRELGEGARTYIARGSAKYSGDVIGETDLHIIQQIGKKSAVAHFRDVFERMVNVGDRVSAVYSADGRAAAVTQLLKAERADSLLASVQSAALDQRLVELPSLKAVAYVDKESGELAIAATSPHALRDLSRRARTPDTVVVNDAPYPTNKMFFSNEAGRAAAVSLARDMLTRLGVSSDRISRVADLLSLYERGANDEKFNAGEKRRAPGGGERRTPEQVALDSEKAQALRTQDRTEVLKKYPELKVVYAMLDGASKRVGSENQALSQRVVDDLRGRLATHVERGEALPKVTDKERPPEGKLPARDR